MQDQPTPSTPPGEPPPAPKASAAKTWGVIAAVVSAAAGVASAIAAFMGGGSDGPAAAPPPTAQSTVTAPGPAPAGTATGGAPTAGNAAAVRWSGKVRFGLSGLDLSTVPPKARSGDTLGGSIWPSAQRSGSSGMKIKGQVAPWAGPGDPTAEGCRTLLQTQPQKEIDVLEGDRVCVVDDHSPIGVLTVTATYYDAGSYGELAADLTVWNLKL